MVCVIDMKRLADIEIETSSAVDHAQSLLSSQESGAPVAEQSSESGLSGKCEHSWRVINEEGEIVCTRCGEVNSEQRVSYELSHNVSNFTENAGRQVNSIPIVRDRGLGTVAPKSIGTGTTASILKSLNASTVKGDFTEAAYRELRVLNDKFNLSEQEVLGIIASAKKIAGLPEFMRVNKKYLFAALIYIERKKLGVHLDLWHMAKRMGITRDVLGKYVYQVSSKVDSTGQTYSVYQLVRICNSLGLPEKIKRKIYEAHEHPTTMEIRVGRKPQVLYAYLIAGVCKRMKIPQSIQMITAHCKSTACSVNLLRRVVSKEQEEAIFGVCQV